LAELDGRSGNWVQLGDPEVAKLETDALTTVVGAISGLSAHSQRKILESAALLLDHQDKSFFATHDEFGDKKPPEPFSERPIPDGPPYPPFKDPR